MPAVAEPVPADGVVFTSTLAVHIVAGLICVVTGLLATTAAKRPGRHTIAGTIYVWSLAVVVVSATIMASLRFAEDWHLLLIAVVAFAAGSLGYLARRRRWRGWLRVHLLGMSGSYIALLTGFYVDNGPRLPLWNRLPLIAFWLLPGLIGVPLVARAMARRQLPLLRRSADGRRRSGAPPGRPG
jgi:peptidoglycan/LPS O-acetylase OafA/YrhL